MSRISFRVISIDLKDSTLQSMNQNCLMRLNLTQRPNHKTEEYLLKNAKCLQNINHEFCIEDAYNKVQRLTLTLRSVYKKTTFASIFNLDNNQPKMSKPKDMSVDRYIQGCTETREGWVDCEYVEPKHSLIGYCTVDLKEIKKGENNTLRLELLTRVNVKVVGYVNLEVYTWDCPTKDYSQIKCTQFSNEPIMFVDPGCPPATNQVSLF